MTTATANELAAVAVVAGGAPKVAMLATIAVVSETPPKSSGATAAAMSAIVVMNETPPKSGGALISAAAIVAVQIEYHQPERRIQLPLITGPNAFPLFIARI